MVVRVEAGGGWWPVLLMVWRAWLLGGLGGAVRWDVVCVVWSGCVLGLFCEGLVGCLSCLLGVVEWWCGAGVPGVWVLLRVMAEVRVPGVTVCECVVRWEMWVGEGGSLVWMSWDTFVVMLRNASQCIDDWSERGRGRGVAGGGERGA